MKRFVVSIVFLLLPAALFAQQTYVPDDNFEQALIDLGYDTPPLNDSVPTANINIVPYLRIDRNKISDLTGIEDFTALQDLVCADNELTSLDLSNNYVLARLYCELNNLTSLDVSNNTALVNLSCGENELTSLDVNNNSALEKLTCEDNSLTSLDVSNNFNLDQFYCNNNNLTSLNIKNGNNINISDIRPGIYFNAIDNPDLYCIQVDDSAWSANSFNWKKDDHAHYSEDCGYTGVEEFLTEGTEISVFPNPFLNSATIKYTLDVPANVRINVYDNLGQEITILLDNFQDAGTHSCVFNSDNLSPGVYFYKIQIDNAVESGKLLLIK